LFEMMPIIWKVSVSGRLVMLKASLMLALVNNRILGLDLDLFEQNFQQSNHHNKTDGKKKYRL
jgi:hypothetical protein